MKKFFLYGAGLLLLIIVIFAIAAPKTETVKRSIVIQKPVNVVYPYFASLQNMEEWSPWAKKDPSARHEYIGAGNSVGSVHAWYSEHEQVGSGEQEITSMVPNKEIYSELRFKTPMETTSEGFLIFEEQGNKTKVTWGYNAKYGVLESMIMTFLDLDKIIGKDFEQGLNDAKIILEK
ncbi:SRPBCC family protein [Ochrovirga pacifica]|uniref:SRPBCC family protein n=1 Tax=Ochrovirga pacifica TaxID=1042376 RepID=UPI000255A293|nr:SRPBCC family protein [Ochrovirga pacifica]